MALSVPGLFLSREPGIVFWKTQGACVHWCLPDQHKGREAPWPPPRQGWWHPVYSGSPLSLLMWSPSSRWQREGHRHVPAVYSAWGGGCDPAEADSWGGRERQQEAVNSVAGGHAQGRAAGWTLLEHGASAASLYLPLVTLQAAKLLYESRDQ